MRKLLIILTMVLATAFTACKTEEKEMVEAHEKDILVPEHKEETLQINFETFKEVKRVGENEAIIYTDGDLLYSRDGDTSQLTLEDALREVSIDVDPYHVNGNVEGSIYKATFRVVKEETEDTSMLVEKYYYIDVDTEVIIPIED